jgi:hypothetical protein
MKLGIYRNYPWLYAKLLNISQPYKKTVLMYKSNHYDNPPFKSIEEASKVVGRLGLSFVTESVIRL